MVSVTTLVMIRTKVSDALTMFSYVTTDSPVGKLTLNLEERLNSKEQIGS